MRVIEALLALILTVAVLVLVHDLALRTSVASRTLIERAEGLEARRLALDILERELAGARPGTDVLPDPAGVALRAFRGQAELCAGPRAAGLVGVFEGLRAPDPRKDSLELVFLDGSRGVVALLDVEPAPDGFRCPGAAPALRLRWDGDDRSGLPAVFARLFERGLYAVDDALRYRRGAGGRQPISAAVLDPARSSLVMWGGVVELRLAGMRAGGVVSWRWGP